MLNRMLVLHALFEMRLPGRVAPWIQQGKNNKIT